MGRSLDLYWPLHLQIWQRRLHLIRCKDALPKKQRRRVEDDHLKLIKHNMTVIMPLVFALLLITYIAKIKLELGLNRPDRIFHQYIFRWKFLKTSILFVVYIFIISTKFHITSKTSETHLYIVNPQDEDLKYL